MRGPASTKQALMVGLLAASPGVLGGALGWGCAKSPAPREVTVAVAMSLREVMPALVSAYEARHRGTHVVAMYGASGDLERQIEAGAPVDAVVFAGAGPVDALVAKGYAAASSRRVVASNELVLVGPKGGRPFTFATLGTLPAGERLAIGDPRTVPAGEYAHEYLARLGEWDARHALAARLRGGNNPAEGDLDRV